MSRAVVGTGHKMAPRVPLRAPPPALQACRFALAGLLLPALWCEREWRLGYADGATCWAMAQTKPTISRAMAVVTTFHGLPLAIIAL